MSSKFDEIMGCGKIALGNIYKLTAKVNGASKYEILTYIYLSQIADKTGKVEQFTTKDLARVIQCDPRTVFVVLKSMEAKGLIKASYYNNKNWSGIKDIKLTANDFSNVKDFRKHRYLSSFYPIFDFSADSNIEKLNNLSLYALRLLLIILTKYQPESGLKISYDRLKSEIKVEKRCLIHKYLLELEPLLGKEYFHKTSKSKEIYSLIYISLKNPAMIPEKSPADKQMSYYKRHWLLIMKNNDMTISRTTPLMQMLNYIFSTVYTALKNGNTQLQELEKQMISSIQTDGNFIDLLTLYHASLQINASSLT